MTKQYHARYTVELRSQAVQMALEDGFGVAETARRLSIAPKTLANWVTQYKKDKEAFLAKPGATDYEAENSRLRKENAQLKMERDILKKATAFFAKESL